MNTEKSKGKRDRAGCAGFGCTPEDFERMLEMMNKCCAGQDRFPDCSAMMEVMMERCFGPKKEDRKTDGRQCD